MKTIAQTVDGYVEVDVPDPTTSKYPAEWSAAVSVDQKLECLAKALGII